MSNPPKPLFTSKIAACLLLLCAWIMTACIAPTPQVRIRLSTGERVVVNMRDGSVEGSSSKLVKAVPPRFMINPQTKSGIYTFGLAFPGNSEPASIRIDDVSDSKATVLLQEDAPVLKDRAWVKTSAEVDMTADYMKWVHDIDDSFRVYAIHVTFKDGQKAMIYQSAIYFGIFKQNMMQIYNADPKKP